jgi:Lar family restriction alleviation protein
MGESPEPDEKPCPFCGSERLAIEWRSLPRPRAWVRCRRCGAQGPTSASRALVPDQAAVRQWNRRAAGGSGHERDGAGAGG